MVFLLGYLALLPSTFLSPSAGIAVLLWMTLLAPYNFVYGIANIIPVYLMFLGALGISLATHIDKLRMSLTSTNWFMMIFIVQGIVSSIFAVGNSSWNRLEDLVKILIVCIALTITIVTRKQIHAVIIAVVLGLGFHGLTEGLKVLASGGGHVVRGILQLGDNNSFGMAMLMVAPLAYYLYSCLEVWWLRLGFLGVGIFSIITVVGTNSRGAFIALFALGVVYVVRSRRRFRSLVVLFLVVGLIGGVASEHWLNRMATIEKADDESSFTGRITAWKLSFVMALDRPITGIGLDAGQETPVWRSYIPAFQKFYGDSAESVDSTGHAAHSIIFEVLADLGFVGLAIFLMMILIAIRNLKVIRRLGATHPDLSWARDLAIALELSLTGYVVAGLALSVSYYESFYILITIIAVLRRLTEESVLVPTIAGR
jgi:probable O-glycosylation ligase (exosortase A-associated)